MSCNIALEEVNNICSADGSHGVRDRSVVGCRDDLPRFDFQSHEGSMLCPVWVQDKRFRKDLWESASHTSANEDTDGADEELSPITSAQSSSNPSIDECLVDLQSCLDSNVPPTHFSKAPLCKELVDNQCGATKIRGKSGTGIVSKCACYADLPLEGDVGASEVSEADGPASSFRLSRTDQILQSQEYVLPIMVQNTFITVDDCSPSIRALRRRTRSYTLPATTQGAWFSKYADHLMRQVADDRTSMHASDRSSNCDPINASNEATIAHRTPSSYTCPKAIAMETNYMQLSLEQSLESPCSAGVECSSADFKAVHGSFNLAQGNLDTRHVSSGAIVTNRKSTLVDSLSCTPSSDAGCFHICWIVNAHKVRGNEKQAMSPNFVLPLGPGGECMRLRLVVYPKTSNSRATVNFKNSKEMGYIQIKCDLARSCPRAPVRFKFAVGAKHHAQGIRGPVGHDFAKDSICGLPRHNDCWDLKAATELRSMTFPIFVGLARVAAHA